MSSIAVHPAYDILESSLVEEYGIKATLYSHKKTGAEVMSVETSDENKVFGINFRTPPSDSTGIPHILEHSVLCGSRKYPVKEPFVDLLKGSLQNFLNAFTYPDRTCYPLASTNTKDFYNLVDVYLDAVLFPRAVNDENVFRQEGWHYELEEPSQPLTYKGVVYNEMKGVYSNPDSIAGRAVQQKLFPHNAYGVDSGGDPLVIPSLTFQQFKKFHSDYYHPSNSKVFFYGDDDPAKRLELLDSFFCQFQKQPVNSHISLQKMLDLSSENGSADSINGNGNGKRMQIKVPHAEGSKLPLHTVTVNWLLNAQPMDSAESLAVSTLDHLLLGTSASVLQKALTDSKLGESVTGGGLSDELVQSTYSVGLKGVQPENVEKVEALILSTLQEAARDGFPADAVAASLNTIEFRLREFNTGSYPRGLYLMLGMLSRWIYDRHPLEGVRFETSLKQLKQDLESDKTLFQKLIQKFWLSNNHRITVELVPDAKLEAEVEQEEISRLEKVKSCLTQDQILEIIESTKRLKEAQLAEDSPEAKASIPRLSLEDIDRHARELPIDVIKHDDHTLLVHSIASSSGVLYCDLALDWSQVLPEDRQLLPLFARMLTESGTTLNNEVTLSRKIGSRTGGISASIVTDQKRPADGAIPTESAEELVLRLVLRGKAVSEKSGELFDLMAEVLTDARLDNQKRAVEMLKESKARKQDAVVSSGHSYGASRLAAKYSKLGQIRETLGGLSSVRDASVLLQQAENNWPDIHAGLLRIRNAVVRRGADSFVINLTGDENTLASAKASLNNLVGRIPAHDTSSEYKSSAIAQHTQQQQEVHRSHEGFIIPSQVNYVCKAAPLFKPGERVSGAASVFSRYLSTGYLWDNVRVVGGAYGGFARLNQLSGLMSMLSYRDPNLAGTLDAYSGATAHLANHPADSETLLQAVIGTVGDLDSPMTADQKGYASMSQYLSGESSSERQLWRDQVLATSESDFSDLAHRLEQSKLQESVVVFGSKNSLGAVEHLPAKFAVELAYQDIAKGAAEGSEHSEQAEEL